MRFEVVRKTHIETHADTHERALEIVQGALEADLVKPQWGVQKTTTGLLETHGTFYEVVGLDEDGRSVDGQAKTFTDYGEEI